MDKQKRGGQIMAREFMKTELMEREILGRPLVEYDKIKKWTVKPFYFHILAVAMVVALIVVNLLTYLNNTYFVVQVIGVSMMPTIEDNSIVVAREYFSFESIEVGDVVIAKLGNRNIIKTVAAVEGDSIVVLPTEVYINGELVQSTDFPTNYAQELVLLENEFFLFGDNINDSGDSRNLHYELDRGIFTDELIMAKVIFY